MKAIYFDMDGTIADFYNVENWLDYLLKEQTKPYRVAKPLCDMRKLSQEIKRLQSIGYKVGIISWLSRNASDDFGRHTTIAKANWLSRHLGSVVFDEVHIIGYGTPKHKFGNGILFDDEINNRMAWNNADERNQAFDVHDIVETLTKIR